MDEVLHLEGAHDEELLALEDGVALGDVDLGDRALEGRSDRFGAGRSDGLSGGGGAGGAGALARSEVFERGERVTGVDGGAGLRGGSATGLDGTGSRKGGDLVVDPAGVGRAGGEVGVFEDVEEERDVGLDASELKLLECAAGATGGLGKAGRGMDDHLGDQRVEVRVGGIARRAIAVDADARTGGRGERGEGAAGGTDAAVLGDALGVHAGLDRVAARRGGGGIGEA